MTDPIDVLLEKIAIDEVIALIEKLTPPLESAPAQSIDLGFSERRLLVTLLTSRAEMLFDQRLERINPAPTKGRRIENAERDLFAAVDVVLEERRSVPTDAAKAAAMMEWKLSKDQLRHALDRCRTTAEQLATEMSEQALRLLSRMHRARIANISRPA